MLLGSSRPYPRLILEESGRKADDDDDDESQQYEDIKRVNVSLST